jgi:hypothetical protein
MFSNKPGSIKSDNEENVVHINITIKNVEDMCKGFGSLEQNEKSLNKELEEHIFNSIRYYPLNKDVKLVIYIEEGKKKKETGSLRKIIWDHFKFKAAELELYLQQSFKQWRINMLIGVLFLILCLMLIEILDAFQEIRIIKIISESLAIIGWVALWEPLTFILFGWRQIKRDKQYYKKLSSIPVTIVEYISRTYGRGIW